MRKTLFAAAALAIAGAALAQSPAPAGKASQPAVCNNCHKPAAGEVRGYFDNVAFKSQSIQLAIDAAKEIVRFDPKTLKVIDAGSEQKPEHLYDVRVGHESLISYVVKDGQKWATEIRFKGAAKVAKEDLVDYAFVRKLVDRGSGDFVLVDSRPLPRFQQGTIPGAINVPYPAFDKFANRLPASKNTLVVFFCQGLTCQMSPMSQSKAKALGYTNTKVYHEGVPEWQKKDYLATTPEFVKAAYLDKDIPAVLLDVRSTDAAMSGHIKGAVNMPAATVKARARSFPDPKLEAPIIVYDGRGGADAIAAARALIKSGQGNVQVVAGGLLGWQAAGYAIESGVPAAIKVAYAPKPRAGSIPVEEFRALALKTPADVLILDVRNKAEANAGMIKGAVQIAEEELQARIAELPKDKRIIIHCTTGVRAEMAYHKLKEAGYKAGFLNAEIAIAKDGSFKLASKA
ncbi:MAG: rhodanese-like domain-containing protein [Gemmatimonadota bacterium]